MSVYIVESLSWLGVDDTEPGDSYCREHTADTIDEAIEEAVSRILADSWECVCVDMRLRATDADTGATRTVELLADRDWSWAVRVREVDP